MEKIEKKHNSVKMIIILVIIQTQLILQTHSTLASTLQLQGNIIIDGDFSSANLNGQSYQFLSSVPGWNCDPSCQVDNCTQVINFWDTVGIIFFNCSGNALDIQPQAVISTVTQYVNLTKGNYLFSTNFGLPSRNITDKTLLISFNNQTILSYWTNSTPTYPMHYFETIVEANQGINEVLLTMDGLVDGDGHKITNVQLRRIIYTANSTYIPADNTSNSSNSSNTTINATSISTNATTNSSDLQYIFNLTIGGNLTQKLNSFPGSRVILNGITSFYFNLYRLQFYIYHKRNYSAYSLMLLQTVNYLQNLKGTLFQNEVNTATVNTASTLEQFINGWDFKSQRTDAHFLNLDNNGDGLIANNTSFFVFDLPTLAVITIICLILFRITRKYPVSILFRNYFFLGILFSMAYEGNIQSFSFFAFSEFSSFYSICLAHKAVNVFILLLFFTVMFTAIAFFLWFKAYYQKNISYLVEGNTSKLNGIVAATVDKRFICLVFGGIHCLALDSPQLQILMLGLWELFWMLSQGTSLFWRCYKSKTRQCICLLSGLIRILFIISFYVYDEFDFLRVVVNDMVQYNLLWLFIVSWILQFSFQLLSQTIGMINFFRKQAIIKSNDALRKKLLNLKPQKNNKKIKLPVGQQSNRQDQSQKRQKKQERFVNIQIITNQNQIKRVAKITITNNRSMFGKFYIFKKSNTQQKATRKKNHNSIFKSSSK